MTGIPEDVIEAAKAVHNSIVHTDIDPSEAIARAILAERERCALIAEGEISDGRFSSNADRPGNWTHENDYGRGRYAAAAAIRGEQ